ncbi:ORF934 [White spot syndrome virus]|uniref:ORF934 n=1 Tax=White spot syndrome virus TaxID=342409 RepID=A0A2D3I5F9_9VIRU|nr:ORF934 [White spot syndrome virus]
MESIPQLPSLNFIFNFAQVTSEFIFVHLENRGHCIALDGTSFRTPGDHFSSSKHLESLVDLHSLVENSPQNNFRCCNISILAGGDRDGRRTKERVKEGRTCSYLAVSH